jgi:hypothetical protein
MYDNIGLIPKTFVLETSFGLQKGILNKNKNLT